MRIRDWDNNLKIRLIGEALMNITFWMFFPFLTIYFSGEFGKTKAGLFLIFSQTFSVLANLLGGYYADRFGRKRMMVFSAFMQGIFYFIFSMASSPLLDSPLIGFISFAFIGFFNAFYWPASQAMVADVVKEKDRNGVFAVFYTASNIAVVIGPLLGAIFYKRFFSELLLICGLLAILLGSMLAKWTRETVPPASPQLRQKDDKWYLFILEQFKDYGNILKDRVFLLFIIAGVLSSLTYMQLDLLFPVYTEDSIHNQTLFSLGGWSLAVSGEQAFGVILAQNGLMVVLFTVMVTKWMTRYKERNIFILSSFMYAVAVFLFGQTQWIWGLMICMIIFTFGELMIAGIQQSFISKISPENMRGQYFAAASLRFTIGRTIAPISMPLTILVGYQWTFAILSLIALSSSAVYWIMFSFIEKPRFLKKKTS
jgi:MFS family permease